MVRLECNDYSRQSNIFDRYAWNKSKIPVNVIGVGASGSWLTLALAKMTEDSDLKTIIGEFKTKYPVWFGESEEDDDKNDKNKDKGKKMKEEWVKNICRQQIL